MTVFEQKIYNTYLRVLRTHQDKPFKYRKKFDDLDTTIKEQVTRLAYFFNKYKHIRIDLFFQAPYNIYNDTSPLYLDYYLTHKATKAYSLYITKLKYSDPDSEPQLRFIIDSFNFIKKFCTENNISIHYYCNFSGGITYAFLEHLKHFQVSPYALFNYEDFEKNLLKTDKDILYFILSEDYVENFYVFRNRYLQSKKCKKLSELAFKKIKNNYIHKTHDNLQSKNV